MKFVQMNTLIRSRRTENRWYVHETVLVRTIQNIQDNIFKEMFYTY